MLIEIIYSKKWQYFLIVKIHFLSLAAAYSACAKLCVFVCYLRAQIDWEWDTKSILWIAFTREMRF